MLRQLDALDTAYSSHHGELLRSLHSLEAELAGADHVRVRGAHEQISFIRVGLRCLADAIGELRSEVTDLAGETSRDDPRGPR